MKKLKYIMIDGIFPVLFTEANTHREIGSGHTVTSAGFVSLRANESGEIQADVYGESISLGLKSSPNDSAIITRMFSRY